MSIFTTARVTCPKCGSVTEISWAASLNADRRPDLRAQVMDRSFQAEDCASCGEPLRLPPHLTYVDMGRRAWILVEDTDELAQWATHEAEAQQLFADSFGPDAPQAARALAEGVNPRLVFGWPALREKIMCNELALDDVTLELLKLAVASNVAGAPLLDGHTLRLTQGDATRLTLAITDDESEEEFGTMEVQRSLVDVISGDLAAWAPLRAKFENASLVDVARLIIG